MNSVLVSMPGKAARLPGQPGDVDEARGRGVQALVIACFRGDAHHDSASAATFSRLDCTPQPGPGATAEARAQSPTTSIARREALEIAAVGGQQAGLAMGQHGRDDVGVVHLAPGEATLRHSSTSRTPTSGPSSSSSNAAAKRSMSASASAIVIGSLPAARPRDHREVLPHDLSADGEPWLDVRLPARTPGGSPME